MVKEIKTLNGYEIVDEKAREDIEVLQKEKASVEELNAISEQIDEALTIAKGATRAFVYDTYSDMISELNSLDKAELSVNYHVMIREIDVPDLWVSEVSEELVEYTYTSDEDFITDLMNDGVVQVGYFVLSALETQKVDLSEYVKNTDYSTATTAGVVKVNNSLAHGLLVTEGGLLVVKPATNNQIDVRNPTNSERNTITTQNVDYAVRQVLIDSKIEWTDEQKQAVRTLLELVGTSDYAAKGGTHGIVKIDDNFGIGLPNGASNPIAINMATKEQVDNKTSVYRPITPSILDYAVMKALSDSKLEWTDDEKASALELLGGVDSSLVSVSAQKETIVLRGPTGAIYVGAPTSNTHATTKKYVDDLFNSAVPLAVTEEEVVDEATYYTEVFGFEWIEESEDEGITQKVIGSLDSNVAIGRDIRKFKFRLEYLYNQEDEELGEVEEYACYENVGVGTITDDFEVTLQEDVFDEGTHVMNLKSTLDGTYLGQIGFGVEVDVLGDADMTQVVLYDQHLTSSGRISGLIFELMYEDVVIYETKEISSVDSMTLISPNGTQYKVTVADDGTLTSTKVETE